MCTTLQLTDLRDESPKSWYSQAFEKPGQGQATWPPYLSFVSPNPVTISVLTNQPNLGFWRA